MAGPADWGAQPVDTGGPASWGAVPVTSEQQMAGAIAGAAPSNTAQRALSVAKEYLNPFSESNVQEAEHPSLLPTGPLKGLAAGAGFLMSPVTDIMGAAAHAAAQPFTSALQNTGEYIAHKAFGPDAKVPTREEVFNKVEPEMETALGLAMPGGARTKAGFLTGTPPATPLPAAPTQGPFGVTLSKGEEAGDLAMRQTEQQAIRQGTPHSQDWVAQRQLQLDAAKDRIASGFDPFGSQLAETPNEAGALLQQGLQRTAASRKAAVDTAYQQARGMPGEIHADVFRDMPAGIKQDLSAGTNPVIVDNKLTPYASQMIEDIDNRVGQLQIQNRAGLPHPIDPLTGQPMPITGINLEGVDQMRKRLSAFRNDAFASGNRADGRAAKAVLDAFDDRIDTAVNSGMFNGHPDAVNAWNDARAAHKDYRSNFFAGKNDPAGRVVEKILGKYSNNPMAPDDVARYFTGGQGVTSNSLNVNVANKMKGVLGEQSPEWIGIKQGVFRNLVEKPQGMTDFGTGQIANRLSKFVNSDLARAIYTPQNLQVLQRYSDLMRKITMPTGSYFPSAPAINRAIDLLGGRLATLVGSVIGGRIIPIPVVGEAIGAGAASGVNKIAQGMKAAQIAKQLPLVADQMQQWQRATAKAQRLSRGPGSVARSIGAGAATKTLINSLGRLGIDGRALIAAASGNKQGQQDQTIPPAQQKAGGRVEQQRAAGGKVEHKFNPESIGARKAKNGHYYIPDAKRPGKYLLVLPKKSGLKNVVH